MTLNYIKYYQEIKNRFILLFFTWLICLTICCFYKETILFILVNTNTFFPEPSNKSYFIFTNITEIFYVYFEIVVFVSNQIAIIILLYQIFMFLSLGLYQFELIKFKLIFQIFIVSWIFSSILLLKLIVPFSWNFFLSFHENLTDTQSVSLFFEAKLSEYLQYFINLYYMCLTSCQFLILVTIFLTKLSKRLNKNFRKIFYLVFIVFSTIITPPDILSQIVVSSILILIYEFLIIVKEIKVNMANN